MSGQSAYAPELDTTASPYNDDPQSPEEGLAKQKRFYRPQSVGSVRLEEQRSREGRRERPTNRRDSHASRQTTRSSQEQNLTELAAPDPVQDREQRGYHREDFLEEAGEEDVPDYAQPPPDFGRGRGQGEPPRSARRQRASEFATQVYIYSYLIFFSILGTLARLGVQWLTFYPAAPVVTPVLWANFSGSLIMGFLSEDRRLFRDEWGVSRKDVEVEKNAEAWGKNHAKVKKTIPLYIGLATGFCGSFTSFSSFIRDVFLALSNDLPTPLNHPNPAATSTTYSTARSRNGGYSLEALLGVIILTTTVSISALTIGAHFALALDRFTPTLPFAFTRKILDRLIVPLALGSWLGAVLLCIWPPDRPNGPNSKGSWANETWRGDALFALVFAPLGCLARYWLSLKINAIRPSFPLGTFAVNIFGTAVLAMCYDLQHVALLPSNGMMVGGGTVGCQVLQGVMDGFCGALTTVSTWVAELKGLRRRHAWVYGGASVAVALGVCVVVMGSVRWTVGWTSPACASMRTTV